MSKLDRDLEYLMWFERHRERWIAVPLARHGPIIIETDYGDAVPLYFIEDDGPSSTGL